MSNMKLNLTNVLTAHMTTQAQAYARSEPVLLPTSWTCVHFRRSVLENIVICDLMLDMHIARIQRNSLNTSER